MILHTVSGSSYVTMSNVYLHIAGIVRLLNQSTENSEPVFKAMALKMKKKCDKYWGDIDKMNLLIFIGVMLDLVYKFKGLKLSLQ